MRELAVGRRPYSGHPTSCTCESCRLEEMVLTVAQAMYLKLIKKKIGGYHGWERKEVRGALGVKLREHTARAAKDPEQWLDVVNLAAMLWYGRKKSG